MIELFHQLNIGEFFVLQGKTYQKTKPRKKNCCGRILYNALLASDPSNINAAIVVANHQKVEVVENPDNEETVPTE